MTESLNDFVISSGITGKEKSVIFVTGPPGSGKTYASIAIHGMLNGLGFESKVLHLDRYAQAAGDKWIVATEKLEFNENITILEGTSDNLGDIASEVVRNGLDIFVIKIMPNYDLFRRANVDRWETVTDDRRLGGGKYSHVTDSWLAGYSKLSKMTDRQIDHHFGRFYQNVLKWLPEGPQIKHLDFKNQFHYESVSDTGWHIF